MRGGGGAREWEHGKRGGQEGGSIGRGEGKRVISAKV